MMQVIGRFAPEQHIYSIDELFLSFNRCYPAIPFLKTHGMKLKRALWKECHLPVCVGFGVIITLAKIANQAAKKIQARLKFMGINTALELDGYPPALARKEFNVEVERTIREINGQPCKAWDQSRADKKSTLREAQVSA